jgi:hypothetical protein
MRRATRRRNLACTLIAAIDDDNTRNGLIGELRGFVEDGIKLARTTRVMAEQGTSYEDARDAAVSGISHCQSRQNSLKRSGAISVYRTVC